MREFSVGEHYQHYKGNVYQLLAIAKHTESGEKQVVYQDTADKSKVWVTPYERFTESVEHNGVKQPRFSYVIIEI
jgi:hypothetical protein